MENKILSTVDISFTSEVYTQHGEHGGKIASLFGDEAGYNREQWGGLYVG